MVFSEKMLAGKTVTDVDEAIKMLGNGISIFNLYIIFIDKANSVLMEIVNSTQIFKPCYAYKNIKVIAIANGAKEALEMAQNIVLANLDTADNAKIFKARF